MTERILAPYVFNLVPGCKKVVYRQRFNCPDCIYGVWCKTCNNSQFVDRVVDIVERP